MSGFTLHTSRAVSEGCTPVAAPSSRACVDSVGGMRSEVCRRRGSVVHVWKQTICGWAVNISSPCVSKARAVDRQLDHWFSLQSCCHFEPAYGRSLISALVERSQWVMLMSYLCQTSCNAGEAMSVETHMIRLANIGAVRSDPHHQTIRNAIANAAL